MKKTIIIGIVSLLVLPALLVAKESISIEKSSLSGMRWLSVRAYQNEKGTRISGSIKHITRLSRGNRDHIDYAIIQNGKVISEGSARLTWRGRKRYPRKFKIELNKALSANSVVRLAFHTKPKTLSEYHCESTNAK